MYWNKPSTDLGTHICIKLIDFVKKHPVIYLSVKGSSLRQKKNRNEINKMWDAIATDIGISAEDCKRRWKGLKDVYAKIRKRRLQEVVLGIEPSKKWLYEDIMSFMTFPFEQPYQKLLENFEGSNCKEFNTADAQTNHIGVERNEQLESSDNKEMNKDAIGSEEQIDEGAIEYLDFDLNVKAVLDSEQSEPVDKSQIDNRSYDGIEDGSHGQTPQLTANLVQSTAIKPRSRYRAICPKPYQPNILNNRSSIKNLNPVVTSNSSPAPTVPSITNLNLINQIIVTRPPMNKGKNRNTLILSSPNMKIKSYAKVGKETIRPSMKKVERFGTVREGSSIPLTKSESSLYGRSSSRKATCTNGIELFFESMARTVMKLPMRAQAEIKMEICKIVSKAEIHHVMLHQSSKLESHRSKSKKS